MTEWPWAKGPSYKSLDGLKRYEVKYRYRVPGEATWNYATITKVNSSEDEARGSTVRFLSRRHRWEVDVLKVTCLSEELPIQTGGSVETVTQSEYASAKEKAQEEAASTAEERLREMGFVLPRGNGKVH